MCTLFSMCCCCCGCCFFFTYYFWWLRACFFSTLPCSANFTYTTSWHIFSHTSTIASLCCSNSLVNFQWPKNHSVALYQSVSFHIRLIDCGWLNDPFYLIMALLTSHKRIMAFVWDVAFLFRHDDVHMFGLCIGWSDLALAFHWKLQKWCYFNIWLVQLHNQR